MENYWLSGKNGTKKLKKKERCADCYGSQEYKDSPLPWTVTVYLHVYMIPNSWKGTNVLENFGKSLLQPLQITAVNVFIIGMANYCRTANFRVHEFFAIFAKIGRFAKISCSWILPEQMKTPERCCALPRRPPCQYSCPIFLLTQTFHTFQQLIYD